MIDTLPLFHRIKGQPVIVLGTGDAAEAKRRLVERAGGQVFDDMQEGIDRCARLAFVAYEDREAAAADALRLRGAGLLVNVVDQPDLCDFTTPSILDRSPVLIAVGTGGVSAGLAKQLRLRLEALLPQGLGALAQALGAARAVLRGRFPDAADRRRALDVALGQGGMLDPLDDASAGRVEAFLAGATLPEKTPAEIVLTSPDPDDLTIRQARWLGGADGIAVEEGVPDAVLARARADAIRLRIARGQGFEAPEGVWVVVRNKS
ncbi:precorrin-2 dehydrogenase/sirohydrochlorin ferrochelatase family protein [Novosphingobium humi]|uniref:precorrin-2 dehydrogenase/sirohydrochlorin ferrochelatase family protein n=1 Tax=Novosphingobium humi TaxID=2282397 RepID=UPI0025B12BB7|nr:NAD(P)-dependent oxidoreductase [Novosphingobium humi]WJS98703.1 siroheme synthase [Novosphingobium humi]